MGAKSDELLGTLMYASNMLARPTFRNLTMSYEEWSYRSGFAQQVQRLARQRLIEAKRLPLDERIYRLTDEGRLRALGGRDPEACWGRRWDGLWRLVVYDVPMHKDDLRLKLRRYLRNRFFGCLQQSLWITPDSLVELKDELAGLKVNVESLIIWEARAEGGESDEQIVSGAWDWDRINKGYSKHLEALQARPTARLNNKEAAATFQRWSSEERSAWLGAVAGDPLLPAILLPKDYLGKKAWSARLECFAAAAAQIASFRPENAKSKF